MTDDYIKGIFTGLLLACALAYIAPKAMKCTVKVDYGKFATITIGEL